MSFPEVARSKKALKRVKRPPKNPKNSPKVLDLCCAWRLLVWALLAPILLSLVCLSQVPETPHWLAQKARLEEALGSLALLRNNGETQEEVLELSGKYSQLGQQAVSLVEKMKRKLSVLSSKSFLRAFLIAEPLNILLSCSGLSMLMFYSGTQMMIGSINLA